MRLATTSKTAGAGRKGGPLDISVIICTRDRAPQLAEGLRSFLTMRVPAGLTWELLVVDNGSSDDTIAVAQGFADRLPVRVVREDAAGLSHARNRGVREALGTYICWTDDDLVLDPDWLAAYAEAFARHPDAAVFGGKIIPRLEAPSPDWFRRRMDKWPISTLVARRNLGDAEIPLDFESGAIPWGANFAVRTAEQRVALYDPALGVSPLQRRLGEESEVIFRILRAGATGWWVPKSVVQHIIPHRRQTWKYVFEYFRANGETIAYLERTSPGAHHLAGDRRALMRARGNATTLYLRAAVNGLVYLGARLVGATDLGLRQLMKVGAYVGAAQVAASPPPTAPAGDSRSDAA